MKSWIKCIIAGSVILAIGIAIVIIVLACNGWSVKNPEFEMKTFTATEDNTKIDIDIAAGSVKTEFYDGDKIVVEYPTANVFTSEISENDGVFSYASTLKKTALWGKWDIPDTVIKLPKGTAYNLDFELNAGSANIAGGTYGSVEIEVSAGSVNADGIVCAKIVCDVSAGKLEVKNLDCPDIKADVSAGTVTISIIGSKFDYDINAHVSAGSCNVSNQAGNGGKKLDVECSAGSVTVLFGLER